MAPRDGACPPGVRTRERGIGRSVDLFRAFRVEQTDPDHFYRIQAADSVDQLRRYARGRRTARRGRGRGRGYFTEAFTAAGARCVLVEPEAGARTPAPP